MTDDHVFVCTSSHLTKRFGQQEGELFLGRTSRQQNTQWGIQKFLGHLRNSQVAEVWASQNLWSNNIYHWGVMNIHQVYLQSRPALLEEALEALKFCYAKSNLTQVQFSIAAYDVNFDSSGSICQPDKIVGNFTRTELLYNLNRLMRDGEDLSKDITCIDIVH
ncbi:uncharacterized protein LOC142591469 [Dermacentor variabilis]|uniref:uncharacterized protein LOC142591469 n=1 Tax=Dermacentor variabilis TaxID=34621 RepID=UPI003F5C8996